MASKEVTCEPVRSSTVDSSPIGTEPSASQVHTAVHLEELTKQQTRTETAARSLGMWETGDASQSAQDTGEPQAVQHLRRYSATVHAWGASAFAQSGHI